MRVTTTKSKNAESFYITRSYVKSKGVTTSDIMYPIGGTMENYQYGDTEKGSGQEPACPPVIANNYMHYALVWWFKGCIQLKVKG